MEGIQIVFRVLLTVASVTLVFVLLESALDLRTTVRTSGIASQVPCWRLEAPHITSAGTQVNFLLHLGALPAVNGNKRAR